jgi:hypothetical protein
LGRILLAQDYGKGHLLAVEVFGGQLHAFFEAFFLLHFVRGRHAHTGGAFHNQIHGRFYDSHARVLLRV